MNTKELEFTKMVKEQKNTIYTVCMMFGEDAPVDDLVQQTLINLWKGYDSFQGRSSIGTWVWKVAMNTCITAKSKESRHSRGKSSL
ncbi:MAG: sigma-70 family RNA polymerase sigma factor, partial [Bacteroidia bacterium]|nr:sigma-70 family RNA polymerase sigma factor [Bacteroidia bacterium]